MNTDLRRTVFCLLLGAEDYMDAFEKLMKLGLKGNQDREIVYVLVHCATHVRKRFPSCLQYSTIL
jgi:nucleolar MIF4G domain-containing protein 1